MSEITHLYSLVLELDNKIEKLIKRIKDLENKPSVVNHNHYHYNSNKTYMPSVPTPTHPWEYPITITCGQKDLG